MPRPRLRPFIVGTVLAGIILAGPGRALAATAATAAGPGSPSQFTKALDATPDPGVGRLLSIAHNAGDSPATTAAAVAHDAGAVEIDVVRGSGALRARHNVVAPLIGGWLPSGRRLGSVWDSLGGRPVLLDLKSTSPAAMRLVVKELARHPGVRVLASTPSLVALDTLRRDAPNVTRLLSVRNGKELARVLGSATVRSVVQGVSIRQQLLTADVVASLHGDGLLVQAWTVNTVARMNELTRWSVDGVTTDNLTILDAVATARSVPSSRG